MVAKSLRKAPGGWGGFFHAPGSATYRGDSFRGVRRAARRRGARKAIDINTTGTTSDGKWIGNHWGSPLQHGFHDPGPGKVPASSKTWDLPFAVVHRFRTKDRKPYRIQLLVELLALAAKLGVRVELEVKRKETAEHVRELVESAAFQELMARDLIVVKTLASMAGSLSRLEPFAEMDVPTLISFTGYTGPGIDAERAAAIVTYYRGKPKWR